MATKKAAIPQDEKFEAQDFDLFKAIEAIDRKDYGWFDNLNDEQQRKFVPYLLLHWISAVKASGALGAYYVMSTDANANKHMFNERVQQHHKLQWLMLVAASPGMGKQFHQWIPHLNAKLAELKTAATKKEVKDYFDKVFTGASSGDIDAAAVQYVKNQHHKVRLAKMYPEMKIVDIEELSKIVTEQEIDQYEKESGN